MNKVLMVTVKNVYGKELVYAANETAKIFANIAKQQTLSNDTLKFARSLGYEIVVKQTVLEFS